MEDKDKMNYHKKFVEPNIKIIDVFNLNNIILLSRTPVEPISDGGDFNW